MQRIWAINCCCLYDSTNFCSPYSFTSHMKSRDDSVARTRYRSCTLAAQCAVVRGKEGSKGRCAGRKEVKGNGWTEKERANLTVMPWVMAEWYTIKSQPIDRSSDLARQSADRVINSNFFPFIWIQLFYIPTYPNTKPTSPYTTNDFDILSLHHMTHR